MRPVIQHRISRFLLSVLLAGSSILPVCGQNFVIKNYQTDDGLPHNNVRAITADTTGFLWIATWDGLSRFDGHEFKNYFHNSNDSASIPFFSVLRLYVDRYNTLWLLTDWRQLVRYNRSRDDFETIKSISGIPTRNIVNFSRTEDGNLWIINPGEIIYLDDGKKESIIYRMLDEKGEPLRLTEWDGAFAKFSDDEFWLVGVSAFRFKKDDKNNLIVTGRYQVKPPLADHKIDFDYMVHYDLIKGNSGSIWLITNTGLLKFDKEAGEFREFRDPLPEKEFKGRRFFLWGTFNNGIFIYDARKNSLRHIPYRYSKMPISFAQVSENQLWFSNSTSSGVALGVNKLVFTPDYFSNHLMADKDSSAPAIYSLLMNDKLGILVGVRGFDHIVVNGKNGGSKAIARLDPELLETSGHIRSLINDEKRNGIWIGYFNNLLQFYDLNKGKLTNHFPEASGFRAMTLNKDGKLIIGTTRLVMYDPDTGKTEALWDTINQNGIFKLYLDKGGILWGGMSGRYLLRYDTNKRIGKKIPLTTDNCNIEDIIEGDDGDLWLALLGEGVCRYNPGKNTFRYYTTASGLSNNTTYNLLRDKSGNIWVSTNSGISVIQPETGRIRSFGINEGLKISEFNSGAKYIGNDGRFYFGGMGGYAGFYPDSVNSYLSFPGTQKILLTTLRSSSNYIYLNEDLNSADTIILEKGSNNFRLSFSSSDFLSSDKTLFRYRIDEIDQEWNETNANDRNLNYTNLAPRWYHLTIEATDATGNWNASRFLVIRVRPMFYETWLFKILAPLIIISIIVFIIFLYIRQLKQKEHQVQNELKLQALRGQMNPHFIFNSPNSINYFISKNDRLSANRYIADFSRLIRSILSNLGNNYVSFENEFSSIGDYLKIEHLRFSDKFDYEILGEEELLNKKIEVCPGLVQPVVENAIWHGLRPLENRKGLVTVKFKWNSSTKLICIVEDDGIGRRLSEEIKKNQAEHNSKGLNLVNERLHVISKIRNESFRIDISDLYNDRTETGTRVIVEIPINTAK